MAVSAKCFSLGSVNYRKCYRIQFKTHPPTFSGMLLTSVKLEEISVADAGASREILVSEVEPQEKRVVSKMGLQMLRWSLSSLLWSTLRF